MPIRTRRLLLATAALTATLGACERLIEPVEYTTPRVPVPVAPDAGVAPKVVVPADAAVDALDEPEEPEVMYANTKGSLYDAGLKIKIEIKPTYANTKGSHYDHGFAKHHEKPSPNIVPAVVVSPKPPTR